MKWVLKTSSIIVGTANGKKVFRSVEECPPDVRRRLRETLPGPDACTIMITNRAALEAIRSRARPRQRAARPPAKPGGQGLVLPRWQILAGLLVLAFAAITALLSWAVHSQ